MDSFGDSQPTQATQNVVDPRRLGQQNSGFSDEDISDIICLLVPYSECARSEVARIATESSQHMVGRDDTDGLDVDYSLEDDARNFGLVQQDTGEHHIALRFSASVKDPVQGFTFGRNPTRCDICFQNDPFRRLSNIHFRIYFNEWSVLMLEDLSTNGTIVDDTLLKSKSGRSSKRTLSSGSKIKILLHQGGKDLIFLVRIPLLHDEHRAAYQRNLEAYMENQARLAVDANATIVPGPGGHVDLFRPAGHRAVPARPEERNQENDRRSPNPARLDAVLSSWPGSDKYNRVGEVGRGAFATVYMVTSKFNGSPYAAKELDKRKFMKNGILDQKVENEMKIMQQVDHPNIVRYIEHLDWNDRLLIIIMEFIHGGDLGKLVLEHGPLPESMVQTMAVQLLDALRYLHKKNITHRDVKPDNILVKSLDPFVTKLTDFGLSKMVETEDTFLRTFCGTLLYCAPEVYSEYHEYNDQGYRMPKNQKQRPPPGQRYGHAVDVWSLGGVLFYSLTKKPPFPAKSGAGHSELLHQIMTKPLDITPLLQAGVSQEGIDFLVRMLDRRPESRASVEDLLQHSWVGGPGLGVESGGSQSFDEIEDEELRIEASQLSLRDSGKEPPRETREEEYLIPASDDEILDEEDINDENHFSGYESEKENYTFGPGNQPQRLFGEVNVSAVGRSGAIPPERLNLPLSANSSASTEILRGAAEIRDSFESDLSTTPRPRSQKSQLQGEDQSSFVSESTSVNALNNRTFDAESQSLGGAESILEHLNMKSRAASVLLRPDNLSTSKRKSSLDLAEDSDDQPPAEGRVLKRIRSAGTPDVPGLPVDPADYGLFACMPAISRTRHQVDTPVHKSTFWIAQDRKTWHLRYPEMTQLQFDAFKAGAANREEVFGPGKSPLWDLAMKYFPPTVDERVNNRQGVDSDDASTLGGNGTIPSTLQAATGDPNDIPDTQPREVRRPIPCPSAPWEKDIVACLRSARGSAIPNISTMVTESMISWGRAAENTRVYVPKSETRVPKYSFKILLWREGYDPYRDVRPWNRRREFKEDGFHFYISTKATCGIWINGVHLPSYDHKSPNGPCRHWVRLHDGDSVVVWQTADSSERTELIFNCDWGDSRFPRPPGSPPTLVDRSLANKLDEICYRTERKMRGLTEHDLKMEEADHDITARMLNMARERERTRIFELARLEAARGGRKVSPSGRGPRPWAGHVPGSRTVPTFRSSSPTISEALRAARGG